MSNLAQRRLEALQKQLLLENLQSNVGHPNKELIKVVKTTDVKEKKDDKTQAEATAKVGASLFPSKTQSSRLQLKVSKNESTSKGGKDEAKEKEKSSLTRLFKIKKDTVKREKVLKDVNSKVCIEPKPSKSSIKNKSQKKSVSPKNEKTKKPQKNTPESKKTISATAISTLKSAKQKRKSLLSKLVERRAKSGTIKAESTASSKKSAKLKQSDKTNESSKAKKSLIAVNSRKTLEVKKEEKKDGLIKLEYIEHEKSKDKHSKDCVTEQERKRKKPDQNRDSATSLKDEENRKSKKLSSSSITNFKIPKVSSTVVSSSEETMTKQDIVATKSGGRTPLVYGFEASTLEISKPNPSENLQIPKLTAKTFQFSSVTDKLTKTIDNIFAFFSPSRETKKIDKPLDSKPEIAEPSEAFSSAIIRPFQFSKSIDSFITPTTGAADLVRSDDETKKTQNLLMSNIEKRILPVQSSCQFAFELPKSTDEHTEPSGALPSSNPSVNIFQFKAPDTPKAGLTEPIQNTFEKMRGGRSEKSEILKTTDIPTENFNFFFESQSLKDEKIKISSDDSIMTDCYTKRIKLEDNEFTPTCQSQFAETYPRRKNIANQRLMQIREKLDEENFEAGLTSTLHSFANSCQENDTSSGSRSYSSGHSHSLQLSESTSDLESDEPMDVDEPMEIDEIEITPDRVNSLENNLMKLTEKKSSSLKLSAKNKFCIVLDTNVLLRDLAFIERITSIEFPAIGKPIVIVPYCVLQELDTLKAPRLGSQKNVSLLARNAIRYINEALTKDPPEVKGQSGTEDRDHRIFIKSADDCIINCCLQIANACKRLILISYDKNLVNKAIFNQISSCSPQELMSSVDNT